MNQVQASQEARPVPSSAPSRPQMRSPLLEVSPVCAGAAAAGPGASSTDGVHTMLHSFANASPCGSMPPAALTTLERPCTCGPPCQ